MAKICISGKGTKFDCVMIAGVSKTDGAKLGISHVCGLAGLKQTDAQAVAAAGDQRTLCSKSFIL